MAEKGSYGYDYNRIFFENISLILFPFVLMFVVLMLVKLATASMDKWKYGYSGNKKIDKDNAPMYRDIPCNKDIYYANTLIKLNSWGSSKANVVGVIILKWVKENKIGFITKKKGILDGSVIDLTLNPSFDNETEEQLFKIMYKASKDGYLETKEFEKWCYWNDSKFFSIFDKLDNGMIYDFKKKGMIYKRRSWKECKCKKVMNDQLYEDSLKLYGLKRYLEEFSNMNTKEVMDVKLWDEYLMFAFLFGIATKVMKQLKHMYPEVVKQIEEYYTSCDTLEFIDHISTRGHERANDGSTASVSGFSGYSSGGGGYSSGGGGGGSFGGGGGGSR